VIPNFRFELWRRGLRVGRIAKDDFGLNVFVFADQLYSVFTNHFYSVQ
jgi:hypothetical protein